MERHSTNFHLCTADSAVLMQMWNAPLQFPQGYFQLIGPGFSSPGFGTKTVISLGVDIFDFEFEPISLISNLSPSFSSGEIRCH